MRHEIEKVVEESKRLHQERKQITFQIKAMMAASGYQISDLWDLQAPLNANANIIARTLRLERNDPEFLAEILEWMHGHKQ